MHTEPAGQEPRRGIPCPLSLRPGNSRFSREELHQTLMVVYTAPVLSLPINRNLVVSEGLCANPGLEKREWSGCGMGLRQSNNPICSDCPEGATRPWIVNDT